MSHRARKRFGQNFLHDPGVIRQIVRAIAPQPTDHLVEIGPGQGAITRELLPLLGDMDVVELDRDLIQPLAELLGPLGEVRIHNSDALQFDFCQLHQSTPLRVVGNLPYNISTPLLFHLLDQANCIQDMHFMLQKEVVDRMAATPGSKAYGRLSVMLQFQCEVEHLFDIGPGAFKPAPKVDSAFARLTPRTTPIAPLHSRKMLDQVVTLAFAQRRKTLRNSLSKLLTADQIASIDIDPTLRAERLDLKQFASLANLASNTTAIQS